MKKFKLRSKRTNIVIPLGRFSFFVNACLNNVLETCGAKDKLRVTFLISKDVEDSVLNILNDNKENCDVLQAPFSTANNHVQLLDWAVREGNLSQWFVTHHCDLFWIKENWFSEICQHMHSRHFAICPFNWSNYSYDQKRMHTAGDFLAAYNSDMVIKNNLYFAWGKLGESCKVSKEVQKMILENRITNIQKNIPVQNGEWMDGSQALTWELYVRYPEKIKILDIQSFYIHLLSIFRVAEMTRWKEDTIEIDYDWAPFGSELWLQIFTAYSYLTTFLFDIKEVEHIALPWSVYLHVVEKFGFDISHHVKNLSFLNAYKGSYRVLGNKKQPIKNIRFGNVLIPINETRQIKM